MKENVFHFNKKPALCNKQLINIDELSFDNHLVSIYMVSQKEVWIKTKKIRPEYHVWDFTGV